MKKKPKGTDEEKKAKREAKKRETKMKNMIIAEKKRRAKFLAKFQEKFNTEPDMNKY